MKYRIDRAAVLGAGVMGSALAAHLANAGIPSVLLDIVPPKGSGVKGNPASREYRDAFAREGLKRAVNSSPQSFYTREKSRLVTIGNFDDDLEALEHADWVLEAVTETLAIKKSLFARIEPHLKETSILSSNTSGLSAQAMAKEMPEPLRRRFVISHFFNPPRYMRLLEIVPHETTDADVIRCMAHVGEEMLGKGVVFAKDTPNFIANRIGTFSMAATFRAIIEGGYSIEEGDLLTGPLIGRPKSASFRTADLVGLDTLAHALNTVYSRAESDESREYFKPPEFLEKMIEKGLLGQKSGAGFYKKVKKNGKSDILSLDLGTFDYGPMKKASFASLGIARGIDEIGERINTILKGKDRASQFVWRVLSETLVYTANRLGEIADDVAAIDNAMRWGYNWEAGPFELWDALGVESVAERLNSEGREVPEATARVLSSGQKRFYYSDADHKRFHFTAGKKYEELPRHKARVDLTACKEQGRVIKKNAGASLIDIGDDVLCLEFHSKMNAIGSDIIQLAHAAVKETEENFAGLVIGNEGGNFSVGANLMLLLLEAQDGNWEDIDLMIRSFQKANLAMKYCKRPVVAAPFGMTLGGGCEIALAAGHIHASAETYMGLVEVGVGLIPAAGGCKELLFRHLEGRPPVEGIDIFPFARAAFETIGTAKVSTSAGDARNLRFLRRGDGVTLNPDRLIHGAKAMVLGLAAQGYRPPDRSDEIPVVGESGLASFKSHLYLLRESKYISEYDEYLGGELAKVLCGGRVLSGTSVTEDYLLQLEREVFLRLCGQRKTQERMQHMLKKGKPLRN
jgi:3-hydroxyacyl-CoA dehydrogenase